MNKKIVILGISLVAIAIIGLTIFTQLNTPATSPNTITIEESIRIGEKTSLRVLTLQIEGMYCPSCPSSIEYVLRQEDGVIKAEVHYEDKNGIVIYDPDIISGEEITQAIVAAGFESEILNDQPFEGN